MPNVVPNPYEVNWQVGHRKWFLNTNLFLIKPFLITKFDCNFLIQNNISIESIRAALDLREKEKKSFKRLKIL